MPVLRPWTAAFQGALSSAKGFPDSSVGKESTCNSGHPSSIPGSGRSPGEGKGYPLQYYGLKNFMDCIGQDDAKSCTRLNDLTSLLLPGPVLSHSPWPWPFLAATAALERCSWASSADTRQHRCPQSIRNIPTLGRVWQALAPCHNHCASKIWLCWDPKVPPQSCTRALRRWPEKTPDTRGAGRTAAPLPHASVQTQGRVVLSIPVR